MLGSELAKRYIDFFIEKGATRLPSDSLVPNDPTLLFTSAGMVQFKPYFLGEQTPPCTRATTLQKCLRTTDIEDVGDTSHCTFFQMLGNFSFGDYFKKDAIGWAWEFLFGVLKLDLERVRVTIYKDDEEAHDLWRQMGMPERKIFRMDEDSNYWFAGPVGPCGPDSEIFYDTQPKLPPTPDGVWDDKRWLEIWNLVFMQFNQHEDGSRTPLPKKNIDTGMGLERTTAAINDLRGPFETDLFEPILTRLQSLSGKKYGSQDADPTDIAFRRVADHTRSMAFCLADGVLPSNVGRGYVVRRIMRRAILAGRNALGFEKPFLTETLPTIIEQYGETYPELKEKQGSILRYAEIEEANFRRTLAEGSHRLEGLLAAKKAGESLSSEDAFTLHTTYGFPVEMTTELAGERGIGVDASKLQALLDEHAEISAGGKDMSAAQINTIVPALREAHVTPTHFAGYGGYETEARVKAIVKGGKLVDAASEGDVVQIVLDATPFYAEAGGQVGDTGWIRAQAGELTVDDTQKDAGYYFHKGTVSAGEIKVGDVVQAEIDLTRRQAIMRNHSTTHLLHTALQRVLGTHVQQRGSLVSPDKLRFDFSHEKGMTQDEIRRVEAIVNEEILADLPIETMEKPIDEAKKMGAMMLFGEKYGSVVRVVQMGDFSLEFCGGTHLGHTSQAGLFKVMSESSSQAGVRRIEAITGKHALLKTLDQERILHEAASALKTSPTSLVASVEKLQAELRARERELATLQKTAAGGQVEKLVAEAQTVDGTRLVSRAVGDGADAESLRTLADEVLDRLKSGVVILGGAGGGKVSLAVKVSRDLTERGLHAGNIVKTAAQ
ncbi:MAG TPA: alanine--tRNA ligase, partial [Capsulimonadaceae bacterium]|nr:alanine--tRNA ligase [Capsulimonadaceae bacterium]